MSNVMKLLTSFPLTSNDENNTLSDTEYDHAMKGFLTNLSKLSGNDFLKSPRNGDLVDVLDPSVHTIPYLYSLHAQIESVIGGKKSTRGLSESLLPNNTLWNHIVHFLETFDARQVRYVGADWRRLVDIFEQVARDHGQMAAAVIPIRTAMLRLDPSAGTFTTMHLNFVRLCLDARIYSAALPITDKIIHSFATKSMTSFEGLPLCSGHQLSSGYMTFQSGFTEKITASDVHEYYLLTAMIYIQLRMWERALVYLEHVLTAPTHNTATALMVESYRKWVLVNTLTKGAPGKPPKTVNSNVLKQLKAVSKHYDIIPIIFQEGNMRRLQAEIEEGRALWEQDGNSNLMHEVSEASQRFAVANLGSIYAAIPIPLVARHLGRDPHQMETYLDVLIADGHLNATIETPPLRSGRAPILRFISDPAAGPLAESEEQRQAQIVVQTARIAELARYVKEADWRLKMSKEFTAHERKAKKGDGTAMMDPTEAEFDVRGGHEAMDVGFGDADDEGEDIMMDLPE